MKPSSFQDIRKELDEEEKLKDSIILLKRDIMKDCRNIINTFVRGELSQGKSKLAAIKNKIEVCEKKLGKYPHVLEGSLGIIYQEYAEAFLLYAYLTEWKVPSQKEVDVPTRFYLTGIGDSVGELKRVFLDTIVKDKYDKTLRIFGLVDGLCYDYCSLVYTDSIVPNLKQKQDLVKHTHENMHTMLANLKNTGKV